MYAPLDDVVDLAARHEVTLVPHLFAPLGRLDAGYPLEETFIKYGVFNGGFVGVGARSGRFLDWWSERSARRCVAEAEHGYMYSQLWLTLAPSFFDHAVVRDRGCNVTCSAGARAVPASRASPGSARAPGAARVCREYAATLVEAGYRDAHALGAPFTTRHGRPITEDERTEYRYRVELAEEAGADVPANPLDGAPVGDSRV